MGMNYYIVIRALLGFKDRLKAFRTDKNDRIIKYFEDAVVDLENEDAEIPEIKDISKQTEIPRPKVSAILKELYLKTLQSFRFNPLALNKCVVTLCISLHLDELNNSKNKEFAEELRQKALEIELELAAIPRIGELIYLDFIDDTVSWNYGHVYRVKHDFTESKHRVIVFAHPFENYYHEWSHLKETYERDLKRWEAIKNR